MKEKDIDHFEKIHAQLEGLYDEILALSKKNPDNVINLFKLKFINQVLNEANEILKQKHKPFKDFDEFCEDDLPSNSDVAFILSQYLNCMEKLRADNIEQSYEKWYWVLDGTRSSIRTRAPKKIKER